MPIVKNIKHLYEINPLACGQAVLSMFSGADINEIFSVCGTERETTLKDMKMALNHYKISFCDERKEAFNKENLPSVALLSLETPECWHWSLYFNGKFYDPKYGITDDFPISKRKYYWEIMEDII